MKSIAVVGTVVYDQILTARTLIMPNRCNKMNLTDAIGGSMHNIAWNLATLKAETHFITKLGNDELALKAYQDLDHRQCYIYGPTISLPTPRFYIMQDPTKEEMFCTITDDFYFHSNDLTYSNAIKHCSYGITDQDDEAFLNKLFQNTPNTRWILSGFVPSSGLLRQIEGIFINEWELLRDSDKPTVEEAANDCLDCGCKWVAVTKGKEGATLFSNKIVDYPLSNTSKSLNTLGCGDAFASGTLYGLLNDYSIEEAIPYGMAAAKILLETPAALTENIKDLKNGISD